MSYNIAVKNLVWDEEKNIRLKKERSIGFDDVFDILMRDQFLDVIKNPSKNFPNQQVFVVKINNYIYYIPFVEDTDNVYLKTIIPSRRASKKYL